MSTTHQVARVALTVAVHDGGLVQLLPYGDFRSIDGRPTGVAAWRIDAGIAYEVIARAERRINDLVIDFEHQTHLAEKNGRPAPAAGWFKRVEWREGVGLFATDVRWTAAASAMIRAGEYKYLSPVFRFDARSGHVQEILSAALTNSPALDGMVAVALRRDHRVTEQACGLTEVDRVVCARLGISADSFLQTRAGADVAIQKTNGAAGGLNPAQLEMCRLLGVSPVAYLRTLEEENS